MPQTDRTRDAARLDWTLLAIGLIAVPLLARSVHPDAYAGGRARSAEAGMLRNTSAAARMLGEFRTAASDILFIKAERYLDSGIGYAPHLEKELLSVEGTTHTVDEHQAEAGVTAPPAAHTESGGDAHGEHDAHEAHDDHAGTQTLIPTPERDYRGWVGRLQRAVKPWRDPSQAHRHTDGRELLPWFRVMTLADPHSTTGYAVGGWWLKGLNPEAALTFVEEGIANNPNAHQVRLMQGYILLELARSHADDPARLNAARVAFQQAAEAAIARLADGGPPPANWTWYDENDALAACRMAVLLEQKHGTPTRAIALARRYAARLPDDAILREMANP